MDYVLLNVSCLEKTKVFRKEEYDLKWPSVPFSDEPQWNMSFSSSLLVFSPMVRDYKVKKHSGLCHWHLDLPSNFRTIAWGCCLTKILQVLL